MSKWKCEICNEGFDNFHAQGFDGKIYCPLCFFKEKTKKLQQELQRKDNVIKQTIEYVKNENTGRFGNPTIEMALELRKNKLLNILRGENK